MPKETKTETYERQIRETIVSQVNDLLEAHWTEIKTYRDESTDSKSGIGLTVKVDASEAQVVVTTVIAFKQVVKDSTVTKLEDPNQLPLPISQETSAITAPVKRGRGRPRKSE